MMERIVEKIIPKSEGMMDSKGRTIMAMIKSNRIKFIKQQ